MSRKIVGFYKKNGRIRPITSKSTGHLLNTPVTGNRNGYWMVEAGERKWVPEDKERIKGLIKHDNYNLNLESRDVVDKIKKLQNIGRLYMSGALSSILFDLDKNARDVVAHTFHHPDAPLPDEYLEKYKEEFSGLKKEAYDIEKSHYSAIIEKREEPRYPNYHDDLLQLYSIVSKIRDQIDSYPRIEHYKVMRR